MGLMIGVGSYASALKDDPGEAERIEHQLASINSVLRDMGLLEHVEPVELERLNNRSAFDSLRYSAIYQLRELYVDFTLENGSNSCSEGALSESHLVCHSDYNGFYLPIKFNRVIADENRIPGTWLGSSYELMSELIYVAPALGIKLEDGVMTDDIADELNYDREYSDELIAWIALFEAARLSVEHNTAIIFS